MVVKHILYIGTDDEFLRSLKNYCDRYDKLKFVVESKRYAPGKIAEAISKSYPCIIYVDFTDINDKKEVLNEVIFLKRYQNILFVSILGDSLDKQSQSLIYASGFQLGHIKGGEVNALIIDSLYIGLNERQSLPQYAKAENIERDMEVGVCSIVSKVSIENFYVETNIDVSEKKLPMRLSMFEGLFADSFEVVSRYKVDLIYPMQKSYILKYPYVGPWDKVTPQTMEKETVKTWLEFNKNSLSKKNYFIQVITKNHQLCAPFYKSSLKLPYWVEFYQDFEAEKKEEGLRLKRPALIFFDLDIGEEKDGEEEENRKIRIIGKLVDKIKAIGGYNPVIIVSNGPAKSNTLLKTCRYPNIISMTEKLSVKVFDFFSQKFLEKKEFKSDRRECFLEPSDPRWAVDISHHVQVTTLSEHEITFISKADLPLFSVLHLTLPLDCFVTVVPSYLKLKASSLGRHYLGFIHGLSEEESSILRTFVNKIIYRPISRFDPEIVETILRNKDPIPQKKEEIRKKAS